MSKQKSKAVNKKPKVITRTIIEKMLKKEAKQLNQKLKQQERAEKQRLRELKEKEKLKKQLMKQNNIKKREFKKQIKAKAVQFKKQQNIKRKHMKAYAKLMKELRLKKPLVVKTVSKIKTVAAGPPPLKKLDMSQGVASKSKYKLNASALTREKAIDQKIKLVAKNESVDLSKAAKIVKGRLNVLRIFHKNKNPSYCKKLTVDMKYIDHKYLPKTAKTSEIC